MSAYIIMIRERLFDETEMATYAAKARSARGDNPPKPLAFYGAAETLEGAAADGIVILECATMDAARDWYRSPAYQDAMQHRFRGADYRVLLVDGLE